MNLNTDVIQKRPGLILPVFFLSLLPANCQQILPEEVASLAGGTFISNTSHISAWGNQAGLATADRHAILVRHCRPALQPDMGISTLGLRLPFRRNLSSNDRQKGHRGGFGLSISGCGIPGYRFTSGWFSCGAELHPILAAGVGIHTWFGSVGQDFFHNPGIGCALGILVKATPSLILAGHLYHPFQWQTDQPGIQKKPLRITAGLSLRPFPESICHAEVKVDRDRGLQFTGGIEISPSEKIRLILAMESNPLNLAIGTEMILTRWQIMTGFEYQPDRGPTPVIQLNHGW